MIVLTASPIDVTAALNHLQSDRAGAIDLFLGVVRDNTQERPVDRLEYEAYDRMAISEMQKIADEAHQRWPIIRYAIIHRKGTLQIGEAAVLIGVTVSPPTAPMLSRPAATLLTPSNKPYPSGKRKFLRMAKVEWVNAHP